MVDAQLDLLFEHINFTVVKDRSLLGSLLDYFGGLSFEVYLLCQFFNLAHDFINLCLESSRGIFTFELENTFNFLFNLLDVFNLLDLG